MVGATAGSVRVAGGLGALGGLLLAIRPAFALGVAGGHRVGDAPGVLGFLPWLPAAVVLVAAGLATLLGRVPRVGVAVVAGAGAVSIGPLLRWIRVAENHGALDLPVGGQAVGATRYDAGGGAWLAIACSAVLVIAMLCCAVGWGHTVTEDDGSFDALRPRYGAVGLGLGVVTAVAFALSPASSSFGLEPGVLDAVGLDRAGILLLAVAAALTCVLAAALRPRMAGVSLLVGVATVLGGIGFDNLLVVVRSPDLRISVGTVAELVLPVVLLGFAGAIAFARQRRPAPDDAMGAYVTAKSSTSWLARRG